MVKVATKSVCIVNILTYDSNYRHFGKIQEVWISMLILWAHIKLLEENKLKKGPSTLLWAALMEIFCHMWWSCQ